MHTHMHTHMHAYIQYIEIHHKFWPGHYLGGSGSIEVQQSGVEKFPAPRDVWGAQQRHQLRRV